MHARITAESHLPACSGTKRRGFSDCSAPPPSPPQRGGPQACVNIGPAVLRNCEGYFIVRGPLANILCLGLKELLRHVNSCGWGMHDGVGDRSLPLGDIQV